MKKAALIWDMDGTLVDSYPAIVPAAQEVCAQIGAQYSEEYIREFVIQTSVANLLEQTAKEQGADLQALKERFNRLNDSRVSAIRPIRHAKEALEALQEAGHMNFIYTHRGESCGEILKNNGMEGYFTEVLTAQSGFARKPEPDAILYLTEKYGLRPERTFYVGDRNLDMEAAVNAHVGGILLLEEGSPVVASGLETVIVHDLKEIEPWIRQHSELNEG